MMGTDKESQLGAIKDAALFAFLVSLLTSFLVLPLVQIMLPEEHQLGVSESMGFGILVFGLMFLLFEKFHNKEL